MYDLIVIGGGPGGACVSSYVARAGHKVLLIEKEEFPRFRIGESLLPYSMEIFQELGFYKDLSSGKYIQKNGASFYDTELDEGVYFDFSNNGKAKFPHAYEVLRSEFDKDFLDFAKNSGVEVRQPETFQDCELHEDFVSVKTNSGQYKSRFIIDASGQASIVSKKFQTKKINNIYHNNFALYAHFEDVDRSHLKSPGDISIGILKDSAWSWVIPFQGNVSSVGIVAKKDQVRELKKREDFFEECLNENKWFGALLKNAKRNGEFKVSSNFSHKSETFCAERWASVGDAMSFLDPVFSSGVHVSLKSAQIISKNLIHSLNHSDILLNSPDNLFDYQKELTKGIERFHNLLQIFYGGNFINKVKGLEKKTHAMRGMTSAVAGGMWEEDNPLFRMGVL